MRELRVFEMEPEEPAAAWRAVRASTFNVISGEIWLTIEGRADDHWLAAGESIELPRKSIAWVSAGAGGARFTVASGPERPRRATTSGWPIVGGTLRRFGAV